MSHKTYGRCVQFGSANSFASITALARSIEGQVKSSYYSPQSKEQNPQQAEQGHAQMQQCV